MRYIPQIIQEPDYIIAASKPHTAVILKMIEENGERFKAILRLKVKKIPLTTAIPLFLFGELAMPHGRKY